MRPNNSIYGITYYGNRFSEKLTNWLIDKSGFTQSHYQISIYYKYEPDGSRLFVWYYIYDCVYWYTSEELGKWFADKLGKISHVKFLGYAH